MGVILVCIQVSLVLTIMTINGAVAHDRRNFWNNIGKPLDPASFVDPLEQMGLDWEPIVVPIHYEAMGIRRTSQAFKILVNSKTGQDIAPCSDTWELVNNRKFYNIARRSLEELGGSISRGGYMHGAKSSLRVGDRCVFLVSDEIPELGFALFNDDVEESHSSRILFYNHHSPGNGIGAKVIVVRKICTNGMVKTGIKAGITKAHTVKGVADYADVGETMKLYKTLIASQVKQLEALAKVKVSDAEALDHFISFVGSKKKGIDEQPIQVRTMQAIYDGSASHLMDDLGVNLALNSYTAGTAYGVFQSVTAYYSHFKGGHSSIESAIKSRVFNEGAAGVDAAFSSLARAYLPKQKDKVIQSVSGF
jgi:hypothetical protein